MKKFFVLSLLVFSSLLWAEENSFKFENMDEGPINGYDGWNASENVRVVSDLSVTSTNEIKVSAWHYLGSKSLELTGDSTLSRSFGMNDGVEQRIARELSPQSVPVTCCPNNARR